MASTKLGAPAPTRPRSRRAARTRAVPAAVAAPTVPAQPDTASPKRRAILKAATELFTLRGYGAVSMDEVARGAGVSKATLYAHFDGKDALFAEMVAARLAQVRKEAESVATHEEAPREVLRAMGMRWLRFMVAPHTLAIFRIVVAEGARFPDLARSFYAAGPGPGHAWLSTWIEEEIRRGRLRADTDPVRAAEQLIGMLRGDLYLRAVLGLDPAPEDSTIAATVEAATETFLRAYGT